ncbi:MAG: PAS domain S-box protein, partial [Rhizobacter sp.]
MLEPAVAPPRPALALPPRPARRRGLWALPLALSLAFVVVVLLWLRKTESDDVDEQRLALVADALSLETQVSGRIERETKLLAAITWMLRRQVIDVSRAEAAWRTEAAWRSAMEDSLTVGLRARDLEGRIVYVNRALADLVGYAPEELVGLKPPMPYWPPDSIEAAMLRHRRNLAGDAPRGGYEARWRHRDGHPIEIILFEAPLVDAAGQHIGWMGSIVDITDRKRLEERERRHTDTMAHHARLTMLGEIASTLAHELNQPLTAISSYNAGVLNSLQRVDPA